MISKNIFFIYFLFLCSSCFASDFHISQNEESLILRVKRPTPQGIAICKQILTFKNDNPIKQQAHQQQICGLIILIMELENIMQEIVKKDPNNCKLLRGLHHLHEDPIPHFIPALEATICSIRPTLEFNKWDFNNTYSNYCYSPLICYFEEKISCLESLINMPKKIYSDCRDEYYFLDCKKW